MNEFIQFILAFLALGIAVFFLVKKFFFKKATSNSKACGKEGCGCH